MYYLSGSGRGLQDKTLSSDSWILTGVVTDHMFSVGKQFLPTFDRGVLHAAFLPDGLVRKAVLAGIWET